MYPAAQTRVALLNLIGGGTTEHASATDAAHMEIIAERLRLLYVGITRARHYLAVSWSREIPAGVRLRPAIIAAAFRQLRDYCQARCQSG